MGAVNPKIAVQRQNGAVGYHFGHPRQACVGQQHGGIHSTNPFMYSEFWYCGAENKYDRHRSGSARRTSQ